MVSVAIDGPAGAGKSTLARRLAAEMGYIYVDTGAMFRTIGLYALRAGKDPKDNAAVNALLPQIELRLASIEGEQHIYLKEEDVSTAIRTEAAGMAASAVGANPAVRAFLLELQRDMAKKQEQMVSVTIPRGRKQEENFVIVSVNGRSWKIMRGVEVSVPDYVAEVLENGRMMAEAARRYVDERAS